MNFGITGNLGGYGNYAKIIENSKLSKETTTEETVHYNCSNEHDEVSISKEGYEKYIKSVSDNEQGIQQQESEILADELQEQYADIEKEHSEETVNEQEEQSEQDKNEEDKNECRGGCVGINAQKLARMLAAAKTRSQVQAVITKIQSNLNECEAGGNNNMDVDEASVKAAEQLLQEAKNRMGSAENRETTPEEEMAAALAALM
ncbi:MAG: hypothetical protein HDT21_10205 [Ruminococcus sp.]|nr:hypothetical protein [Ruminococcus sp.]